MIYYKKKKSNGYVFVTVVVLMFVIVFSSKVPNASSLPSNVVNTVLSPINRVFYAVTESVSQTYSSIFGTRRNNQLVADLTRKNNALKEKIRELEIVTSRETFLKNEEELISTKKYNFKKAQIISKEPSIVFNKFGINIGSLNNVKVGDVVVEGVRDDNDAIVEGLVGYISQVGPVSSQVISLMDDSVAVSIMSTTSNEYGIINKRENDTFYGYMFSSDSNIKVGDTIVTSGMGEKYPRGLYIGTVKNVKVSDDELTKKIEIKMAVNYDKLYRVLVFNGQEKHE